MGLNDDMHAKLAATYGAGSLNDLIQKHEAIIGRPGTLFTQAYYLTALPAIGLTPVSTDYNDMAAQYWAFNNLEPVLIQDQILSGTSADVQFLSIPQTFRDLELVIQARGDTAAVSVAATMTLNNDTAANYNTELITGTSTTLASAVAGANTAIALGSPPAATTTASFAGLITARIANYTGTTFFKNVLVTGGWFDNTTYNARQGAGVWRNTAAVTRLDVLAGAGNFIAGSRFTLLGYQ